MLSWLEGTPVSEWVSTSDLGYPILLAIHSMGMATVVGILVLLDLRVLGLAKSVPLAAFRKVMPLAWLGFGFNLVSGVMLFGATATHMIANWPFLSKMASICAGGFVSWALWRGLLATAAAEFPNGEPNRHCLDLARRLVHGDPVRAHDRLRARRCDAGGMKR
jgi:hypothetical protein